MLYFDNLLRFETFSEKEFAFLQHSKTLSTRMQFDRVVSFFRLQTNSRVNVMRRIFVF
jgi:hypothetical protein